MRSLSIVTTRLPENGYLTLTEHVTKRGVRWRVFERSSGGNSRSWFNTKNEAEQFYNQRIQDAYGIPEGM